MAERSVIVTLRLDNQQSVRNLGQYQAELLGVRDKIKLLNSIIRENGVANKNQERQLGELTAKARGLSSQIRELGNSLSGTTAAGLRFRDKMAEASRAGLGAFGLNVIGVTAAVTSAVMVLRNAARTVAEFDQGLANIRALGPDVAARIDDIAEAAKTAGTAFGFTAKQSLDAVEELVKAGVSVDDILGGALQGTLTLAAAGEMEVGEAAELAAIAMTQFGLAGQDVAHVADVLTAGAIKALGGVGDLGEALKFIGPVAANLNVSLDETVGTLALFAQSGIKGEQAGTGLRGVLASLTSPSKEATKELKRLGIVTEDGSSKLFDAQGKFLGLSNLAEQLKVAMAGLSDEERSQALGRIFGNKQVTAANVLYRAGAEEVNKWTDAVNDSGIAQEVAQKKTESFTGEMKKLGAAYDAFILSIMDGSGPMSDIFKNAIIGARRLLEILSGGSEFEKGLDAFSARVKKSAGEAVEESESAWLKILLPGKFFAQGFKDDLVKAFSDDKVIDATLKASKKVLDEILAQDIDVLKEFSAQKTKIINDRITAQLSGAGEMTHQQVIELAIMREQLAVVNEQIIARSGQAEATAKAGIAQGMMNVQAGRSIKLIDAEIAALKEEQGLKTDRAGVLAIQQEIDALELEKDALTGNTKAWEENQKARDAAFDALVKQNEESRKLNEQREDTTPLDPLDLSIQIGDDAVLDVTDFRAGMELRREIAEAEADAFTELQLAKASAVGVLGNALKMFAEEGSALAKVGFGIAKIAAISEIIINLMRELSLIGADPYAIAMPPGIREAYIAKRILTAKIRAGIGIATVAAQGFAGGGKVNGAGTTTSDSIPARLSKDEFVVRAKAAKHIGYDFLEMLNKLGGGVLRHSREGGYAGGGAAASGGGMTFTAGTGIVAPPANVLVNIEQQARALAQPPLVVLPLEGSAGLISVMDRRASIVRISER